MSVSVLPTIDLMPLQQGASGVETVAEQIKTSFKEVGFAYVKNHGISPELVDAMFEAAEEFHALPLAAKKKIKQNKTFRGYLSANASQVKVSSQGASKKPNFSEAFIMMFDAVKRDDFKTGKYLAGLNQWPNEMPALQNTMTAYSEAMTKLSLSLVQAFAVAFGLPKEALDGCFIDPTFFLRLHQYPPQPTGTNQYDVAPHTDIGFMTLVAQDKVGGLSVKHPATKEWIDVPYIEDTFVLNAGDMMHRWTNGVYPSSIHRVLNHSAKDRYSVPFFFDPNMHATIEVLDAFSQEQPVRYKPIMYGDYVMERVSENYKALQDK